jgi:UDP-2,3-diacylglucosamine pyrophosphatase LpxH
MSTNKRLTEVFESASEIPFDDSSRFILFSDCHRGDNSWSDDLAHNQVLLWYALKRYYEDGFTYIEVGDGDELWENKKFEDIRKAHSHLYWQMQQFHRENRLYLIWGNHNCGHTHRPMFPEPGARLYFNTGSCVHPRCITGIEIQGGKIELIKWWVKPDDESGVLRVTKETKAGPRRLGDFF